MRQQQSKRRWFRMCSYQIENRVYRLVDDIEASQYQSTTEEQQTDHNINEMWQLDFRQPLKQKNHLMIKKQNKKNHTNSKLHQQVQNQPLRKFMKQNEQQQNNRKNQQILSKLPLNQPSLVQENNRKQLSDKRGQQQLQIKRNKKTVSQRANLIGRTQSAISTLFHHIKSIQLPTLLSYLPFLHSKPTLYSKYKHKSLAILNNSIDLEQAIVKALQYNIPLMQIVMGNDGNHADGLKINQNGQNFNEKLKQTNLKQSQVIQQKILNNFTVAHFINQNFVLYGDWSYDKYQDVFQANPINEFIEQNQEELFVQKQKQLRFGRILFRRGSLVFAEIDIFLMKTISQQELLEKLQQIRNRYYKLKQLSHHKSEKKKKNTKIQKQQSFSEGKQNKNNKETLQNDEKVPSAERLKSIEDQILHDYLQQKKIEEELLEIQGFNQEQNQNDPQIGLEIEFVDLQSSDGYEDQGSSLSQNQMRSQNTQNVEVKHRNEVTKQNDQKPQPQDLQ